MADILICFCDVLSLCQYAVWQKEVDWFVYTSRDECKTFCYFI